MPLPAPYDARNELLAAAQRAVDSVSRGRDVPEAELAGLARAVLAAETAHPDDPAVLLAAFQFAFRTGDLARAGSLAQRRLAMAADGSPEAARALCNLGLVAHRRGVLDEAEALLTRALEVSRTLDDPHAVARDLANLSLVPESRRQWDRAEALLREALEISLRQDTDRGAELAAGARANLGDIAWERGRSDEAERLWREAAGQFERLGVEKWRREFEARWAKLRERGAGA
ncbi:MAG: tetratricopeptide repeat protein [Phycisphaerae bacterium]|nr:tetratricopeptide repeat protein [Phycisphaerae bacterium]